MLVYLKPLLKSVFRTENANNFLQNGEEAKVCFKIVVTPFNKIENYLFSKENYRTESKYRRKYLIRKENYRTESKYRKKILIK